MRASSTVIQKAPPLFGETVLRAAVRHIENQPDCWNQNSFLGTGPYGITMCLAGWIAHLAGVDVAENLRRDPSGKNLVGHVRALLGLSDRDAQMLFWDFGVGADKHPTVDKLKQRIKHVTKIDVDGPIIDPQRLKQLRDYYDNHDTSAELAAALNEDTVVIDVANGGFRLGHDAACEARFDAATSSYSACGCADRRPV